MTYVDEGWWHPDVRKGQVHLHPEKPGGGWSATMHRQCEPVYTRRGDPPTDVRFQRPVDGNHALLVGVLVGAASSTREQGFEYDVEIIDDPEGNHLATFGITAPSGQYLVHVEKIQDNRIITKTGKVLTESDIYDLAAEAEEGYDVSRFKPRNPDRSDTNTGES